MAPLVLTVLSTKQPTRLEGTKPRILFLAEIENPIFFQSFSCIAREFRTWVLTDQLVTFLTKPIFESRESSVESREERVEVSVDTFWLV